MVIGHEQKIKTLQGLLKKDMIPQSLLFWGPEHIGKYTLAQELAKGLLCINHSWNGCSDKKLCNVCSETRNANITRELYTINQELRAEMKEQEKIDLYDIKGIRKVITFLQTKPALSRKKVVIVDDAHLLDSDAQNALLKTIEEPPEYAYIIFVTHKPTSLFETIRSRMTQLSFGLACPEEIERWLKQLSSDQKRIKKAIQYSFLRPGMAYKLLTHNYAIQDFEKMVKALIVLEQKPLGKKLALVSRYMEKGILTHESLFPIWQAILRDELLLDMDMQHYAVLLTRKHTQSSVQKRLAALRKSIELEYTTDNAPNALKSGVELLASSL